MSFRNTPPMTGNLLDAETYDRHRSTLEKMVSKNNGLIAALMKETTMNRRKWILDEKPSVIDILKSFPQLATYNIVRTNTLCIETTLHDHVLLLFSYLKSLKQSSDK